jgi:hypothetical protein
MKRYGERAGRWGLVEQDNALQSVSRHRGPLVDLALDLVARSAGFRRSLPEGVRSALADLMRLAFPATLALRWMPGLFPESSA